MSVFRITLISLRRRFPQIIKAAATTLVAVFFVTAVLIFQENMYQWQMSSNKSRFGDWFICEKTTKEPNELISAHSYLKKPVKARSSVRLYDDDWNNTKLCIGSMTDEFIKQGRIKLAKGRLPEASNEIAMDWNTLLKLGYDGEIGQEIRIHYYIGDSNFKDGGRRSEKFILTGVFDNYTNIWENGNSIPGAVVIDDKLSDFEYTISNIYLYPIKDSVRTNDYVNVYNKIKEDIKAATTYNAAVYDYNPWSSEMVYIYMYVVVMLIGILALSYQLIEYRNKRRIAYDRFRKMGLNRHQLRNMYMTENAFILMPAGIAGIVLALVACSFIGNALEVKAGYEFYHINYDVILKSVGSVIIAIIIEELTGLISNKRYDRRPVLSAKKNKTRKQVKERKSRISHHNLIYSISARFIRKDGAAMSLGIRLFALCICSAVIFSSLKIKQTLENYQDNDMMPDIYGYIDGEASGAQPVMRYWYYLENYNNLPEKLSKYSGEMSRGLMLEETAKERKRFNIHYDEIKELVEAGNLWDFNKALRYNDTDSLGRQGNYINISSSKYLKDTNNNLLDGFSKDFLEQLLSINGIESVSYSAFESQRTWFWDAQDYNKMQTFTFNPPGIGYNSEHLPDYGDRYMFSTEYTEPTKELYKKLEKYIDKEYINYDEFKNGKQVVIFLRDLPDGSYDDTINAGDTLYYNYYRISKSEIKDSYFYIYPYDELYSQISEAKNKAAYPGYYNILGELEIDFDACVSPKVAAVVKVTDEVVEDFNGIIPTFGYYTAIASLDMAQQAVDNQRDVMERYIGQELTPDMDFELCYNQISINYDLSSTFSATNNKIGLFFKGNNVSYKSNVDVKNTYRTQLINSILQYGITIIALVVVQLLIMAIVVRNRIDRRRDKISLLHSLGMGRGKIVAIYMLEALRESVWCIFTMPLILIMELLMYIGEVRGI